MSSRQPSSNPEGEAPRPGASSGRRPRPPRRPPAEQQQAPSGRSSGKRRRPPPAEPKRRPSERAPRPKDASRQTPRPQSASGQAPRPKGASGTAPRPKSATGPTPRRRPQSAGRAHPSQRRARPSSASGRVPREEVPAHGQGAEPPTVPFASRQPEPPLGSSPDTVDLPTRAVLDDDASAARDPLATPSSAILAALDTSAEPAASSSSEPGITAKLGRWIARTLGVGGGESDQALHQVVVEVADGQGEKAEATLRGAGFSVLGRNEAVLRFDCPAERVNLGLRALLDSGLELYGLERTAPDPAST